MRGRAVPLLAIVSLLTALVGGTASVAQERPSQPGRPDHPGRPQVDVPDQSNRPSRFAPCVQGTAYIAELDGHPILETGAFPCDGIDLLSFFTNDEIGGGLVAPEGRGSDVWGWTDPETGREYVIAGLEVGTSFVDITDPKRPVYLAHLPTSASNDLIWRDIKVYDDHAFIVAESAGHGMQVLDLTVLRDLDPTDAPHTLTETAHYDGFQRAHNLAINEDIGFAYAVGQRDDVECETTHGMHIVDIREPTDPTFAGCYEASMVHDAHCLTYDGPDSRFSGTDICVVSTGNSQDQSIAVVDVSEPADPVLLSPFVSYPNSAFSHQGWLLDGHRYYLHNSESTARTPQGVEVFDLVDLTDPQHIGFFENPAQSTQHNLYEGIDGFVYQSNYSSGLRMYDASGVSDGILEEVGYFDVYPPDDDPGFGFGTWSNYPFFDSGVIAVHGYQGLFLVRPKE
jgi:choice-of-anchor B domain-containing protein